VYPLGWGAGWTVTGKQGEVQLSRNEEPEERHWTLEVMSAD